MVSSNFRVQKAQVKRTKRRLKVNKRVGISLSTAHTLVCAAVNALQTRAKTLAN